MLTPPQPLAFTPRDLLRFLYWVFFKPFTLERCLKSIDPALPRDPSLFTLWRRSKQHPQLKPIISLALFHLLLTPWPLGFGFGVLFQAAGFEVNWFDVAVGVAGGVAFILGYLRLPLYLLYLPLNWVLGGGWLALFPGGLG